MAKSNGSKTRDTENGYSQDIKQFIDDRAFKPGFGGYDRPE
jgi:hypothetical protein